MNKITILSISAAFVASILAITAFEAEAKPPSQSVACPAENVQHWVQVSFGALANIEHDTKPTLSGNTVMTIPLTSDDVNTDNGSDDAERVIDKLNALGYFVVDPTPRPIEHADVGVSVGNYEYYSIICAEN